MGIPVVYQFTKLTSKDALTRLVVLEIIPWPTIYHVVMVLHTSTVHIGCSDRAIRIGVLVLRYLECLQGKLLRIACLVQNGFPHQYAGVVTISTNDVASVLMHLLVPAFVLVPILPARSRNDDKKTQFIASIHERRVLRIVGCTDDGKACIAQSLGIAPLLGVRQGIAHIGKVLMAIGTHQLVVTLAIEVETRRPSPLPLPIMEGSELFLCGLISFGVTTPLLYREGLGGGSELEGTNTNTGNATIERLLAVLNTC